jgi:hypothetical protein
MINSASFNNAKKSLTIIMVVTIILVFCYTIIKMYSETYFWYDEAVQFYDAIGINYDSPNVIHNIDNVHLKNSRYNMDPGGYTLILHYWTKISMNPFFIRLLNFVFLVVLISIVVRMTNRCFKENLITLSLLLFLIVFNNAMLIDRAIEVRGYMIEILVVSASVYFLFRGKYFLKQDKFNLKFIGLLLLFCFGMWSRYSAIVSIGFGWFLFSLTTLNLFSRKAIIGHIVLLGNVTTIYLVMLRWQNPFGLPMDYLDYLNDVDGWANLLNENLYFFVLMGFTIFVSVKNMKGDFIATITSIAKRCDTCSGLNVAIFYVIFLNAIYFVLSTMGRHPYEPLSSRNFGVTFSTVLVSILFLIEKLKPNIKQVGLISCFLIIFAFLNRFDLHRGTTNYNHFEKINYLDSILLKNPKSNLFVDYWPGLEIKSSRDITRVNNDLNSRIFYLEQPILVHRETAKLYNLPSFSGRALPNLVKGSFCLVHKYCDLNKNIKFINSRKKMIREFDGNLKLYQLQ